jgi:hypothetical protein
MTGDASIPSVTALLAGVGTAERTARIRIKDFFIGPEASAMQAKSAKLVDQAWMNNVSGISIESAQTGVTGGMKKFTTHIKQLTLHGVATSALCQ